MTCGNTVQHRSCNIRFTILWPEPRGGIVQFRGKQRERTCRVGRCGVIQPQGVGGGGSRGNQTLAMENLDPVSFEILKNSLVSIAEEMGVVLRRSSFSPNIKERRDFSCALFKASGELVAQAEHIPVHLGAMPYSVQA